MKFIRENAQSIVMILFLLIIGIMLLVNPVSFAVMMIKIAGLGLFVVGVVNLIKYFQAKPEVAAKGMNFFVGAVMISVGAFAFFATGWFVSVFPVLAVLYGLLQIALGFLETQHAIDALRMKEDYWWMRAISAAISLLFGFIIACNPGLTFISIWVFTGITLIIDACVALTALILQYRKGSGQAQAADQ